MRQRKEKVLEKKVSIEEALIQVVKLFLVQHPYKLTYSKISRVTKIPRSTLYYYFGSKVEVLLTEAVRFSLKKFLHLETLDNELKSYKTWEEFQAQRIRSSIQQVMLAPWAPRVYMLFRDDSGAIGVAAREVEAEYLKQMAKAWRYYFPKNAINVHQEVIANSLKMGLLWGIGVQSSLKNSKNGPTPILDEEQISRELTLLVKQLLTEL